MNIKDEIQNWDVDQLIECILDLSAEHKAAERDLMTNAPKAYHADGVPLKKVWKKLSEVSRATITKALLDHKIKYDLMYRQQG